MYHCRKRRGGIEGSARRKGKRSRFFQKPEVQKRRFAITFSSSPTCISVSLLRTLLSRAKQRYMIAVQKAYHTIKLGKATGKEAAVGAAASSVRSRQPAVECV
jgi:hypothetical protein